MIMAMVITRFVAILFCRIPLVLSPIPLFLIDSEGRKITVPTRHPPQRLDAPVHVALALEEDVVGVLDGLALAAQVGEGGRADGLGLVGQALARLEALRGAVEAVRARQELLPLLELHVVGVVRVRGVAAAEEGGAVVAQGAEAAGGLVDGGLHVAEALVRLGPGGGGDVLLLELHLAELEVMGLRPLVLASVSPFFFFFFFLILILVVFSSENKERRRVHTNSSASSRARSAWLIAAFRGSPDSSGIVSSFCARSASTRRNSAE